MSRSGKGAIAVLVGITALFSTSSSASEHMAIWQNCDAVEYHPIEGSMFGTETGYEDVNGHLIRLYTGGIYTDRWRDCTADEWLW